MYYADLDWSLTVVWGVTPHLSIWDAAMACFVDVQLAEHLAASRDAVAVQQFLYFVENFHSMPPLGGLHEMRLSGYPIDSFAPWRILTFADVIALHPLDTSADSNLLQQQIARLASEADECSNRRTRLAAGERNLGLLHMSGRQRDGSGTTGRLTLLELWLRKRRAILVLAMSSKMPRDHSSVELYRAAVRHVSSGSGLHPSSDVRRRVHDRLAATHPGSPLTSWLAGAWVNRHDPVTGEERSLAPRLHLALGPAPVQEQFQQPPLVLAVVAGDTGPGPEVPLSPARSTAA